MLIYVHLLTDVLLDRVRAVRAGERRDVGASALEWAIIAAIAVVIASIVGYAVYNVVDTKSTNITDCGNQPVGSAACK
jgi:Flp pilus assembly pilin Flp